MEENHPKKENIEINEELMMNLMVDGVKKEGLQFEKQQSVIPIKPPLEKPIPKDRNRIRKVTEDYESIFFKKPTTNARDGKTVYIRPDFHEKLTRIVQVIGEDKITIYAYLDNLLDYHFQEFGEQITTSFNGKYKPIL
ncbi:DUF3408 domain-containing protein [Flavobacterium sp. GSB-24]|uniref:DUF3408 domain-containing protein n=1 Tax=Flavobacterium sp. GSB-24 TaxID=2994319 RepID=UPI00248F60A0|nr:DUF3408 domain-containing protein [Flavobacterium sp. GSB-24]BDU25188.1 hypothetical protein FLGSB24_19320 [Flavobacterium sp. GSB-24]